MEGLLIIPILAVLIVVHEIGHFASARMVGAKVEEFGIGIPPRAKGWERNGVIWSLNWIPFGGFVRVKGEDAGDMSDDSMNSKSPGQRAFFLGAGSAMNLLLAIVLMVVLVGIQGVPTTNTYVSYVEPESPAAFAGLRPGDRVIRAAGERIDSTDDLISTTRGYAGRELPLTVVRGGEEVVTSVTPRRDPPAGQGPTGVGLRAPNQANVIFDAVEPGSLADQAGVQAGDRVVAINGVAVIDDYIAVHTLELAQGGDATLSLVSEDGTERTATVTLPVRGVEVTQVELDSLAHTARIQPGDVMLAINNRALISPEVFAEILERDQGAPVAVLVQRGDERFLTTIRLPRFDAGEDPLAALGMDANVTGIFALIGAEMWIDPLFERVAPLQIIPTGFSLAWEQTTAMLNGIRQLITGGASLSDLAGPIGMGQIVSESLEVSSLPGWVVITQLSILLSLNLAFLNLLPLPALDGGRLLFVIVEVLRGGRRVAPEREGIVHFVGLVVLLGVMFLVAFGDVSRIITGERFFQ